MASCDFDSKFTKARPHILEKICLSLDYESFKNCLEVNKAWNGVLTSTPVQKKAKNTFQEGISEDERKLLAASQDGKTDVVRKLLSIGMVDVNCVDRNGYTPLLIALYRYQEAAQLLLDGRPDPNKVAALSRHGLSVVQLLLANGADPSKGNLISMAAFYGLKDVVQLLLDGGADPNKADDWGYTPLSEARRGGHIDIVEMIKGQMLDTYQDLWR